MTTPRYKYAAGILIASLATAVLTYMGCRLVESSHERRASDEIKELFLRVTRGNPWSIRWASASDLARHPQGAEWVIMSISDIWAMDNPQSPAPEEDREFSAPFEIAILVHMIDSLPSNISEPTCYALVTLLGDKRTGRYGKESGVPGIGQKNITITTPSLGEIAHSTLVSRLNVDCGIDKEAWLKEIRLRRGTHTTPTSGPR